MDELHDKVMDLIHEEGRNVSRDDYRELLQLIQESCHVELRAMDEDEELENERGED